MVSFGKKMNFRPLLVSIVYFLFAKMVSTSVLVVTSPKLVGWSWAFGFIFFALVAFVYYPNVLNVEFNYFEVTDQKIRYYDYGSRWNRIKMIFLGTKSPLKTISLSSVDNASFFGKEELVGMPPAMMFPTILLFFVGIISSVDNLCGIELNLKSGKKLDLSLARDKIYEPKLTISKSGEALGILHGGLALS